MVSAKKSKRIKKISNKEDKFNDKKALIFISLLSIILMKLSKFLFSDFQFAYPFFSVTLFVLAYASGIFFFFNDRNKFKKSILFLKSIEREIIISSSLFLLFIIIGMLYHPSFLTDLILDFVRDLVEKTKGLGFLEMFWFIFENNASVAFFSIILGIFFGVFPIITVIFNGYIAGFVLAIAVKSYGISKAFRLLPHGIFEIPAILISISIGIKVGTFIFTNEPNYTLKKYLKESFILFLFVIIPLLFLAAFIETLLIFLID